jgi:hypothetical protein
MGSKLSAACVFKQSLKRDVAEKVVPRQPLGLC